MAIKQVNELISIQTMIPADFYNPCRIRKKQQRSCGLIRLLAGASSVHAARVDPVSRGWKMKGRPQEGNNTHTQFAVENGP